MTAEKQRIDEDSEMEDDIDDEDNEIFYENFRQQATQVLDDDRNARQTSQDVNHSKLTEQLIKLIRKGVVHSYRRS